MEAFKSVENQEERNEAFERVFEDAVENNRDFIEYDLPYPKHDFLKYLVENKNILFHGSNWEGKGELLPMPANCRSKEFGNQNAVFSTKDHILPMFYAIRDKNRYKGSSRAGITTRGDSKQYHFGIEMGEQDPWSSGVVCIVDAESFTQGHDDDGEPINEYASLDPIAPLTRLRVDPEDFPYLNFVEDLSDQS